MSILYVIYDHPTDQPNHYVLRQFFVSANEVRPAQDATLHDTLESARAAIPADKTNLGRQPDDDPNLLEVWV